jgi:DNA-binding transcriptional regulator LsrR (DeoR family)
LHAPLIVASPGACESLLAERAVADVLSLARTADVALVGIGSTDPSISSLIRAGYLTESELYRIEEQGAVGDICARHFDISGNILDIGINRRVVGISPQDLQSIPEVIGVAGGDLKAPAILGALCGRLINVLVTDNVSAGKVLQLADG